MALVLADRVVETCTSPGTGAVTLLGAVTGFQTFSSGIGNGNTCYYCIADQGGANWEVGLGTYASSGNTLTRTTPISGSATTPVNFSSGTQNVFVTYPAEKSVNLDASGKLRADSNSYLDFGSASPSKAAGRMWYNDTTGTWNLVMGGGNITQQVGEEQFVYGQASSAISGETTLQLIFKTGVDTVEGTLKFAPVTSGITDSGLMLGVATEDIGANEFGRISTFGIIHGVDTTGSTYSETWANGDVIWYNPTTGGLTKTKPTAPNIKYQVGTVVVASSSGAFQVQLAAGSVLGGTDSNVQFSGTSTNNLIQYNGTYWTNVTPGSVTGVGSVANAVTFNNSGSGAASGTTFDGSAAKTISYNTIGAQAAGTYVTAVSGTSPVVSSGGTTPAISIPQASGSVSGYLSSTDWTTFNNKGSGTVTSVSGTTPISSSGGTTPAISISKADSTTNGYLSSTDWNTFNNKGSGTVTSVSGTSPVASSGGATPAISLATGYGDTQNPYASKTANYFLAAPNASAGAPTFRAIVAADIPTLNQNTSGSSGSCTGNAATATLATKASTLSQGGGNGTAMTFNWSGQSGQPSWLWGSNDGANIYVWNPSNFSVNYATSAGSASSATTASALTTGNSYQVGSLGVGTAASGTAGEIRATNNITAYYSDDRLKTRLGAIEDPISKVMALNGFYYEANETAQSLGYDVVREVGLSAQEVQAVLPEVVVPAPIDDKYLTMRYERVVPLLVEAIKAQQNQIQALQDQVNALKA